MKCVHCGAETPNAWKYGAGGLCNGAPLELGTSEYEAALTACMARRAMADAAVRAGHAANTAALTEGIYNGLPLGLVVVVPAPGDTVTWNDEVGKVVDDSQIAVAFPSGVAQLRGSCTRDGLVLHQNGSERDGYALWLDTPKNRPGDRSWTIKYLDRRVPQVVAVDVITTIVVRGAT